MPDKRPSSSTSETLSFLTVRRWRPTPARPSGPHEAAQPARLSPRSSRFGLNASEAKAHAQRRWLDYWATTHAPAWASRDAFLAACAADPTLTVPVWLSATEKNAAWVAVETLLPTRRVHYLVHRNWDEWWSLWRSVAPRLGSYPVSALVTWLTDAVNLGQPPAPRTYLQKAMAGNASSESYDLDTGTEHSLPIPAAAKVHNALGGRIGEVLMVAGLVALFIGFNRAMTVGAVNAGRYVVVGFGLLVTALGWIHSHTRMDRSDDPSIEPGAIRRLWPLILAGLAWIPLMRAWSLMG